jgi:hypothetical protein
MCHGKGIEINLKPQKKIDICSAARKKHPTQSREDSKNVEKKKYLKNKRKI